MQQKIKQLLFVRVLIFDDIMYSTKQTHGETLPPTILSLRPGIQRSHFQCIELEKDIEAHPNLPSAAEFAWSIENGNFQPILCEIPCAMCTI
jgi:hypothetical protein